jgi:hypothetical protein
VRCGACRHEFLLAFSCKCRQVVLTVPKRLRPYFLYDRRLLGDLSRVAARTVTAFIRATLGEHDLSVGIVSSIQTHGSLANWHPHLHLLVTDGGFRADGTFVRLPRHDVATLTEAFRSQGAVSWERGAVRYRTQLLPAPCSLLPEAAPSPTTPTSPPGPPPARRPPTPWSSSPA